MPPEEIVADPIVESTPAPVETPAVSDPAPVEPAATQASADPAGGDVTPPLAYVPNTKIKVMDKDYDIPKEFHGLMKDKDTEKQVREIFEKAEGLPVVKQRLQETRQQFDTVQGENQRIKGSIGEMREIYNTAARTQNWLKLDQFFEKLEIPKEHIFAYAVAHAKLMEMPPEQQQAVQQSLEADRRASIANSQQANMQNQYARQAQQMKQMEVEVTFANPEVTNVAKDFDTRIGKPGAFRDLVLREGQMEWINSQGRNNLPVRQAVERVMQNFGIKAGQPAAGETAAAVTSSVPGKPVIQKTPSTIPNIAGRVGASPLNSKPKSIDDLKKIYASMSSKG